MYILQGIKIDVQDQLMAPFLLLSPAFDIQNTVTMWSWNLDQLDFTVGWTVHH